MSDLISRKALLETIVNTPTKESGYNPVYLQGCITRQHEIIDMIERMPTIEPPKGEWIDVEEFYFDYRCSLCGGLSEFDTPFCQHCGARMKGE